MAQVAPPGEQPVSGIHWPPLCNLDVGLLGKDRVKFVSVDFITRPHLYLGDDIQDRTCSFA